MQIEQFLQILWARRRRMLQVFIAMMLLALAIQLFWPAQWKASAVLMVNEQTTDPLTGTPISAYLIPGYLDTQTEIISSHATALKVVDALELDKLPDAQQGFISATGGVGTVRDWLAEQLLRSLNVKPARESSLIEVSFSAADAKFATAISNAFAHAYMAMLIDMQASAAQQQNQVMQQQLLPLRSNLDKARQRLASFQKEAGILYDEDQHVDLSLQRLNNLGNQLVSAQSQEADARSRAVGSDLAPDVQNNLMIQNLETQLAAAEAKLKIAEAKFGPNHPTYLQALAERDTDQRQLDRFSHLYVASLKQGAANSQERESRLQSEFDHQQGDELGQKEKHVEFDALQKEVEDAQRAYSQVLQRASDTSLASHAGTAQVFMLRPALEPDKPSFPRPVMTLGGGAAAGLVLAILAAMLAEALDRRVHIERDIRELLDLPVLAQIDYTEWRQASRLGRLVSRMKLLRKVQTP